MVIGSLDTTIGGAESIVSLIISSSISGVFFIHGLPCELFPAQPGVSSSRFLFWIVAAKRGSVWLVTGAGCALDLHSILYSSVLSLVTAGKLTGFLWLVCPAIDDSSIQKETRGEVVNYVQSRLHPDNSSRIRE